MSQEAIERQEVMESRIIKVIKMIKSIRERGGSYVYWLFQEESTNILYL